MNVSSHCGYGSISEKMFGMVVTGVMVTAMRMVKHCSIILSQSDSGKTCQRHRKASDKGVNIW